MGITGEIVRNVFLKTRSRHDRHDDGFKRKWSTSVRSYLCGDEFNSVLATDDSASMDLASFTSNEVTNTNANCQDISSVCAYEDSTSIRSSEATVNQSLDTHSKDEKPKEKLNSTYKLFKQEDAALIIQSAFRAFQERRAQDEHEHTESIGTSIEVQTGNSSDIFSITQESFYEHKKRHKTRAQVLKIQDDWDDSTVSSVISKMRMQNRLEAATRRERALAYAFSQQLRICSKKKASFANGDETNTGWSWLERWMAARQPEINLVDNNTTICQKTLIRKRMLDMSMEERESCGSNEVSSLFEVGILSIPKPPMKANKAKNSFSRQDSASSQLCPRESKDVIKKECHMEDEKEKRKRQKQPGNKKDVKNATTHQVPLQHETQQ